MSVASSRSMSRYPEHWVTFALVFVSSTLLLSITSIIHTPLNGFSITVEAGLPDADGSPGEFARAARLFERADPVADAYSAIQSGKTRLWAGTGSPADWFIQGVPEERFGSYQRRYGLRFLYSGDVLHSDEEMHYRTLSTPMLSDTTRRSLLTLCGELPNYCMQRTAGRVPSIGVSAALACRR